MVSNANNRKCDDNHCVNRIAISLLKNQSGCGECLLEMKLFTTRNGEHGSADGNSNVDRRSQRTFKALAMKFTL